MKNRVIWTLLFQALICPLALLSQPATPEGKIPYSVGGFFQADQGGRRVYGFNQGWRFYKGERAADEASRIDYSDDNWEVVNVPHAIEVLNRNASGGANYQGEVWYRKHFTPPSIQPDQCARLHFEAVMGKCKIYLNGSLVAEHFGGYLPFSVDLTGKLLAGSNVLALCADNSNDDSFPPGKAQEVLDFCYFGGIYRDVWLTTMSRVHVTDANDADVVAGGGAFIHYSDLSKTSATLHLAAHVINQSEGGGALSFEIAVLDREMNLVARSTPELFALQAKEAKTLKADIPVVNPNLWSPESPYLYWVDVLIKNQKQQVVDAVRLRTGMRTIEMDPARGFILNGEVYPYKLMGANRHQDYGYVGNAVTNNLHARDARLFRELGMRSVRSAHYPQDPAFMDAADELGLFVIVATPGWQWWNGKNPLFRQRVYADIRNMVRRDRNHPSTLMWECIINETVYPEDFAREAHRICHEEYPFPGCFTACDENRPGKEYYDVLFAKDIIPGRMTFTREYSSNVDEFTSQNSDDRIPRSYGERGMQIQTLHMLDTGYLGYKYADYATLSGLGQSYVGGTLWPGIEYQRGYKTKPQYGGVLDVFRYPKMSYFAMKCQRDPDVILAGVDSGPAIYIASELTTFSDPDITVYSNCEEVRLMVNGKLVGEMKTHRDASRLKHDLVTFKNAFMFMRDWKPLTRKDRHEEVKVEVEGLMGGRVVARDIRRPAFAGKAIQVWADQGGAPLYADGSTLVPLFARVVDRFGTPLVLNDQTMEVSIEGPGEIVQGDLASETNPVKPEFGVAPILVRVGTQPGQIKVRVSNLVKRALMPEEGVVVINTRPMPWTEISRDQRQLAVPRVVESEGRKIKVLGSEQTIALEAVSTQQKEFDPNALRKKEKQ